VAECRDFLPLLFDRSRGISPLPAFRSAPDGVSARRLRVRERRGMADVGEIGGRRITRRMILPERVFGMSGTIQTSSDAQSVRCPSRSCPTPSWRSHGWARFPADHHQTRDRRYRSDQTRAQSGSPADPHGKLLPLCAQGRRHLLLLLSDVVCQRPRTQCQCADVPQTPNSVQRSASLTISWH
jgi:hypothetical protein